MSFYATIQGSISYSDAEAFRTALKALGDYVDGDGFFLDETEARIADEPGVNPQEQVIRIPVGLHRNLAQLLDELFKGGNGKAVWTSTDGCFSGGLIVDGKERTFDLAEWGKANVDEDVPDADKAFEKYCQWQSEVEEAFHDEFA